MGILGIYASQISGHLGTFAYESIQTVTVGSGGASSIAFTSIPSTYKHLQIRGSIRSNRSGEWDELILLQMNSDTGSSYSWHALDTSLTGSAVYAEGGSSTASPRMAASTGNAANSLAFNGMIVDVLEYANTNMYKTVRALSGWENNNYGSMWFASMNWQNTNAITTLTFKPQYGTGFSEFSKLSLYGVKG